ncbi:MAG TPA: hypothetical protein VFX40_05370 [Gemmatimonadaceae bacterium]|nr:hypothetical protein [Gemmatimonadaceae bacterium]
MPFALLAPKAPLAAQQPSFVIMPKAAVVAQARPFSQQFTIVDQFETRWRYRMEPALAWGALVETPTPYKSLGIRIEMSEAGKSEITKAGNSDGPPTYGEVSARVRVASAAAIFQPEKYCWGSVCPRLIGGAGIKRYDFEGDLLWDDVRERFAGDQSRTTIQLGAGVIAYASRLAIIAEVVDYSNSIMFASADNRTNRVHDLAFTLGAGVRF